MSAAATVVLAFLTGWYVRLTQRLAEASREQVRELVAARERIEGESRRALPALVKRLTAHVDALPFPEPNDWGLRQATLWTEEDLAALERLTRMLPSGDSDSASHAIVNLRALGEMVREVQAISPSLGFDFERRWRPERWSSAVQGARDALERVKKGFY